ncbi:MAG: hypothetical protein K6F86_10815 [Lachnospiraceae bacterium]|nr:hypothetical protein [Lachnospiraceae bacterium]
MKIAHDSIAMQSERNYYQSGKRLFSSGSEKGSFESIKNALNFGSDQEIGTKDRNRDSFSRTGNMTEENCFCMMTYSRVSKGEIRGETQASKFQYGLLYLLIKRLMLAGIAGRTVSGINYGSPSGMTGFGMQQFTSYEEYEETSFQARGQAVTEDGRKIDFNIGIEMSRSYMEYMSINTSSVTDALCDPLVINMNGGITDLTDQKFFFDIDSDGKKDEISMPGKGSGFLALDLNDDGIINNGGELFGTKSGDGFSDLSKYDLDENGWIDENDEIFSKLKVWCKGDHGEDILMDLKKADIGAIFLKSAKNDFTLMGSDFKRNGVIRSTGIFLHESTGEAGTIQHLDLALNA